MTTLALTEVQFDQSIYGLVEQPSLFDLSA